VLVIGVGNDLRRDDAAGRVVASRVEAMAIPGTNVLSVSQLVPEMVEQLVAVDRVVVVDAAIDVDDVTTRRVKPSDTTSAMSHHGDPASMLAMAELIGGPVPETFVVSIPAGDLGLGEGMTDRTVLAVETAVARVCELVDGRFEPLQTIG
jgi:hydrogenase maturation protease